MMKTLPLISIIIPVYNVESYLPDCLDSLLVQTYQNFELLLVDDGSPDHCWEIMQRYAQKDSRVRIFHKENGGVSSARNFGLNRAEGDYIGFVDSDDTVEPQYLEWLYEAICVCDMPIAMCSYRCVTKSVVSEEEKMVTEHPVPFRITEENYSWMGGSSGGHCWRMLTKREILTGIWFDTTLFYGEDALFFMQEFLRGGLAFVDAPLYRYLLRPESAVKQSVNEKIYTEYLAWKKVWELVKEKPDPLRITTEERYLISCAEVYYRMRNWPERKPELEKMVLNTAKQHRKAAWKIPAERRNFKVHAVMIGYCPHLGALLWKIAQWIKKH